MALPPPDRPIWAIEACQAGRGNIRKSRKAKAPESCLFAALPGRHGLLKLSSRAASVAKRDLGMGPQLFLFFLTLLRSG